MSNVTLDQILDALSRGRQRATYGAVAALLDRAPRTLMKGRDRDRRHSWVVNSGNGQPTGYSPEQIDPNLASTRKSSAPRKICCSGWSRSQRRFE
jgi:hypothetical protein